MRYSHPGIVLLISIGAVACGGSAGMHGDSSTASNDESTTPEPNQEAIVGSYDTWAKEAPTEQEQESEAEGVKNDSDAASSPDEIDTIISPLTDGTGVKEGSSPGGLIGGHFDVDISSQRYEFSQGTTDGHVHEYDKKYNTLGVDFFKIADDKLFNITEVIPNTSTRFVLKASNSILSPGAVMSLNSVPIRTLNYEKSFHKAIEMKKPIQVFTLGLPTVEGDTQLKDLRVGFRKNIIANRGLFATETKTVRANDPGPNGEYRNGALTLQALEVDALGNVSSNVLWEATLFWHKKD